MRDLLIKIIKSTSFLVVMKLASYDSLQF